LEEHDARRGTPLGIDGGKGHRIGVGGLAAPRLVEPGRELANGLLVLDFAHCGCSLPARQPNRPPAIFHRAAAPKKRRARAFYKGASAIGRRGAHRRESGIVENAMTKPLAPALAAVFLPLLAGCVVEQPAPVAYYPGPGATITYWRNPDGSYGTVQPIGP